MTINYRGVRNGILLLYPRTSDVDTVGNEDSLTRVELTRQLTDTVVNCRNSGNEWKQATKYCGGQQNHLHSTNVNEREDLCGSDADGGREGRLDSCGSDYKLQAAREAYSKATPK